MERHRDRYAVEKMCKVLKVSRNAYYYWRRTHTTEAPESSKETLKDAIRAVFEESRHIYGSYKIAKELAKAGVFVSRSYVARLMKQMGIRSRTHTKFVATTDSRHQNPVAENVLDRV